MNSLDDTQYVILRKLGEGGMGTVYLAEDTLLKRLVAIKALNKPTSSSLETLDERFQQEALALARLNHPNITHLYSFLPKEGRYWMVMEYLQGESLEQWMQKCGHTSPLVAASIVVQLLDGLNHAHKKGIIHRDLKPGNVMISEEGEVKIMDFGISRIRNSQRITQHGKSVGTLQYMAPEQIKGLEGDERTDIYAAGTILFELLAGGPPFRSDTDYQLMKAKLEENAASLPSSTPAPLQRVIIKALDRNPDKRYNNVLALKEAIEHCFNGRLLRETELFNELNRLQVENDNRSIVSDPVKERRSKVSPTLIFSRATEKFSHLAEIDFRTAVYLLLAVVTVCGGLLLWNNSRQQNMIAQESTDTAGATKTAAVPSPDVPAYTDNPNRTYHDEAENQPSTDNISTSSSIQKTNDQKIDLKKKDEVVKPIVIDKKDSSKTPGKSRNVDSINNNRIPPEPQIVPEPRIVPEPVENETTSNEPVRNFSGKVPAGIGFHAILDETLSSEDVSKDGNKVKLHCPEDIKFGNQVLIRKGATVTGKIVDVVPSRRGKALIGFVILTVVAANGSRIEVDSDRIRQFSSGHGSPAILKEGGRFYVTIKKGQRIN